MRATEYITANTNSVFPSWIKTAGEIVFVRTYNGYNLYMFIE
jgi:hypothetical protein